MNVQKSQIMGVQYLNSFIKRNTREGTIVKTNLNKLSGKTIVIDTSIYLYRFLAEEALLENMYIMISLFRYYNIIPIFVFDGKAPVEKTKLIEKRISDKTIAEKQYNSIKEKLKFIKNSEEHKKLCETMIHLKKKFIRIKRTDILNVKNLINAFGLKYLDAEGEADQLCAKLVIKKHAYACLSEDMDLFIYGCPRVLRYLSLINETVVIYYFDKILENLDLNFNEFKEICVLSGTDYNNDINKISLFKTIDYFRLFKNSNTKYINFYDWLDNTTNIISNIYELYNIYNLFRIDNINLKKFKLSGLIKNVDMDKIKEIMKPVGFIFI
jgi:5'-3' exonuclease